MKRSLAMVLITVLTVSALVGCSDGASDMAEKTETEIAESVEVSADEKDSENVIPDKEETAEVEEVAENEEVVEVEDFEFTEEYALEKIKRVIDSYEAILKSHDNFSINMCRFVKELDPNLFEDLTTSDGFLICNPDSYGEENIAVMNTAVFLYFDNYINNDGDYYSIAKYIQEHTKDEILSNDIGIYHKDEKFNTDDIFMLGMRIIPSILYMHPEKLSTSEILNRDEIEASDFTKEVRASRDDSITDIEYLVNITINDTDTGLYAAFDKDGRFLNIIWNECKIDRKTVDDLITIQ